MSDERRTDGKRTPTRAQIITGGFLIVVSVGFFAISGLGKVLFGADIDLNTPAYILLGVGCYAALGFKIADILDRRSQ